MFEDKDGFCHLEGKVCSHCNSFGACDRGVLGCVDRDPAVPTRHYCSMEKHECEHADAMGHCMNTICDNMNPAHEAAIAWWIYNETNGGLGK